MMMVFVKGGWGKQEQARGGRHQGKAGALNFEQGPCIKEWKGSSPGKDSAHFHNSFKVLLYFHFQLSFSTFTFNFEHGPRIKEWKGSSPGKDSAHFHVSAKFVQTFTFTFNLKFLLSLSTLNESLVSRNEKVQVQVKTVQTFMSCHNSSKLLLCFHFQLSLSTLNEGLVSRNEIGSRF